MKTSVTLFAIAVIVASSGCTSLNGEDYRQYRDAQLETNRIAADSQKPMVEIVALPGQSVNFASLRVYAPTSTPVIQQAKDNEVIGWLKQLTSVGGSLMGIKMAGDAATNLVSAAKNQAAPANVSTVTTMTDASNRQVITDASDRSSTTGAVSSVGDNSGLNSGNSGRIAGTAMSDSTSTPTVVMQPAPVVVTQ